MLVVAAAHVMPASTPTPDVSVHLHVLSEDHILATTLLISHRASSPAGARDEDGVYAGCNDWSGGYLGTCI